MANVRVLFLPPVDVDNMNAQSLNVREIVLRLHPDRIESTLWYEREPDPRLRNCLGVRLLQLPRRGQTFRILRELLARYDIVAYMDYSPASYMFLHVPRIFRGRTKAVFHAEAPLAQIGNPSGLLRFLYRGILPHCDVHTGITEFVAKDVAATVGAQVRYILPVGVDSCVFTPPPERNHSVLTVLFVGTVIERKGPQHLLEAARRFPRTRFRIVGAGRNGFSDTIRQRAGQLNLQNVVLDGPKSQMEVLEVMRQSDILVLPSRLEGIPRVTLEAAATGLPCLVFRDYQTPSVVDGVTGFQVSTDEEMLIRLGQLIDDSDLRTRMGKAAREHVARFDWDVVGPQWESAYLQIAAEH